MEPRECDIHRKHIFERVERNETRLNNHGKRIDALEQYKAGVEQQISNLVDKVDSLITTLKWFIGLMVGSFVGFFFYAVQQGIFR